MTNFPSALTEGRSMYHPSKSDLSKQFKKILREVILESPIEEKNAKVVHLSVVVNVLPNRKSIKPKTFGVFPEYVFVELNNLSRRSARINTVCDLYPEDLSLKESIQIERVISV